MSQNLAKNSELNPSGPAAFPVGNDLIAETISSKVKSESNSALAVSLSFGCFKRVQKNH